MEEMLAIEAETKYLLTASDRFYEQALMQELLRIFKEAELQFGPRGEHRLPGANSLPEALNASLTAYAPFGSSEFSHGLLR